MGTYNVPRNLRGETRILVIFTLKSLATTGVGLLVGLIFMYIFSLLKLKSVGIGIMILFAIIGFVIGRFNVPTISQIPITKKIGGAPLSEIILRYIKFKKTRGMEYGNKKILIQRRKNRVWRVFYKY